MVSLCFAGLAYDAVAADKVDGAAKLAGRLKLLVADEGLLRHGSEVLRRVEIPERKIDNLEGVTRSISYGRLSEVLLRVE